MLFICLLNKEEQKISGNMWMGILKAWKVESTTRLQNMIDGVAKDMDVFSARALFSVTFAKAHELRREGKMGSFAHYDKSGLIAYLKRSDNYMIIERGDNGNTWGWVT